MKKRSARILDAVLAWSRALCMLWLANRATQMSRPVPAAAVRAVQRVAGTVDRVGNYASERRALRLTVNTQSRPVTRRSVSLSNAQFDTAGLCHEGRQAAIACTAAVTRDPVYRGRSLAHRPSDRTVLKSMRVYQSFKLDCGPERYTDLQVSQPYASLFDP